MISSRLFRNVHHHRHWTAAAYGCLKPAPANRLRRVHLHLWYSIALMSAFLTQPRTDTCSRHYRTRFPPWIHGGTRAHKVLGRTPGSPRTRIPWHSVQYEAAAGCSPWPAAFPPCPPPAVSRSCSGTSPVLCSCSTPRSRTFRTYLPWAFSGRPAHYPAGVTEVSRFSRMKFPYVLGVYDYAGFASCSRSRMPRYCLPPTSKRSAP